MINSHDYRENCFHFFQLIDLINEKPVNLLMTLEVFPCMTWKINREKFIIKKEKIKCVWLLYAQTKEKNLYIFNNL